MNAYGQEDPIKQWQEKKRSLYYPVVDYTETPRPFTYNFDGQLGSLDFGFIRATSATSLVVNDAKIWNVNVNEPNLIDYNLDYGKDPTIFDATIPYRFGDHDPIVVSLSFGCDDIKTDYQGYTCAFVATNSLRYCTNYIEARVMCPKTCGLCPSP